MPTFTLNTSFGQEDLRMLYATGTNVVVAKPSSGSDHPNVAWIVFRPLQANSMAWQEQYGIYASSQSLTNGAVLTQMSTTSFPSTDGKVYGLGPAGFFGPAQSGGSAGDFTTVNQYNNLPPNGPGYLTFGLYQNATVNGVPMVGNAVSAAPVLYRSTAVMTPYTTVYLWTQSMVKSNTVVTTVTSVQTQVVFGGTVTEISLAYDANTGGFVNTGASLKADKATGRLTASGGKALPEGISLEYRIPLLG